MCYKLSSCKSCFTPIYLLFAIWNTCYTFAWWYLQDVFALVPSAEIRALREESPSNLATLCYKVTIESVSAEKNYNFHPVIDLFPFILTNNLTSNECFLNHFVINVYHFQSKRHQSEVNKPLTLTTPSNNFLIGYIQSGRSHCSESCFMWWLWASEKLISFIYTKPPYWELFVILSIWSHEQTVITISSLVCT